MTRDILDAQGNVIGSIEIDDSADITSQLNLYTYQVPSLSQTDVVQQLVQSAMTFGAKLMVEYAAQNILLGITQAGKTGDVMSYLQPVLGPITTGSLYTAVQQIDVLLADTSLVKAALAPFVTNDVLTTYKNKIQDYLCIPRT